MPQFFDSEHYYGKRYNKHLAQTKLTKSYENKKYRSYNINRFVFDIRNDLLRHKEHAVGAA